jgi:O-antigen/teichoic acid export membrane protein
MGFGVWSLVWGLIANNASRAVAYQVAVPIRFTPTFSFGSSPLLTFGAILSIDRVVYYGYRTVDALITGRFLGAEAPACARLR